MTFKTPPEIGELLGIANAGRLVHRLVHNFPKLQCVANTTPETKLTSIYVGYRLRFSRLLALSFG